MKKNITKSALKLTDLLLCVCVCVCRETLNIKVAISIGAVSPYASRVFNLNSDHKTNVINCFFFFKTIKIDTLVLYVLPLSC